LLRPAINPFALDAFLFSKHLFFAVKSACRDFAQALPNEEWE